MKKNKVIIIGASHGGHQLAIDLADNYENIDIIIYEESDFVSFMSCGMQLFLEDKVTSQEDVRNFDPDQLNSNKIKVINNTKAVSIDPNNKTITIQNVKNGKQSTDSYDKLILSSGVVPRKLDTPSYKNVLLMRGYNCATQINQAIHDKSIKNVTVIGSGYIGIEAAEVFSKANKNVTLIGSTLYPLEQYLNKKQSQLIEEKLKSHLNLVMGEKVHKLISNDGTNVQQVCTNNKNINTDLVLCAMGVYPNTAWLKNVIDLDIHGYIKTNEYLQTNYKDIYAIGDATCPFYIPAGKSYPIALATVARCQAQYLAHNLFSNIPQQPFKGIIGSSALGIFNYNMVSIGMNEYIANKLNIPIKTSDYTTQLRPRYVKNNNPDVHISLTFNPHTHQLLGASLISTNNITEMGNVISLAIQQKLSLEDLLNIDFFFQPNYSRQLNILVLAIRHALGYKEFY